MRYYARAVDATALRVQELTLEAASEQDALRWVEAQGLAALSVRPDRRIGLMFGRRRFDVTLFLQQLSTLLGAGMTVVEAVETLIAKSADGGDAVALRAIMLRLQEGKPLSEAFTASGAAFPSILIAAVRANETTGQVNEALRDFLKYDAMVRGLQRKAVGAALYPALVVAFGLLVSLFLIGYVVPRFAGLYGDHAAALSAPTRMLLSVAGAIHDHQWLALALLLCATAAIGYAIASGRLWGWLRPHCMRIPAVRSALRTFAMARLHRGLEFLMRGGYPLSEAMPLALPLAVEGGFGSAFEQALSLVHQGTPFSEAMRRVGLTDAVSERLLAVGERSGQMTQSFAVLADLYASEMERTVERLSRVLEPLLLIAVGLFVGSIVLLMYMPVFDLGSAL